MRWELTLECRDCGAQLHYIDERPAWQGAGADRYVACPACDGKAGVAKSGIDLGLDRAFGIFKQRGGI